MNETTKPAAAGNIIKVNRSSLPLCCPGAQAEGSTEMHPRVFLAIKKSGWAECPYCGARYELEA
ncbi:MAG: zinc-finger domain-containing protein [Candidatus Sedimenticola sp. (ex Thyasira tokunagai)]